MTILIDGNQVIISTILSEREFAITEDMIRHFFLNSIRSYHAKHRADYGTVVLCFDSKPSWRHLLFQHYKACRKYDDKINWPEFYQFIDNLIVEFEENLPYKVIRVKHAEGDDIIGTLCEHLRDEPILITSSDNDYRQLQRFPNVKQFSHLTKEYIIEPKPHAYLKENIIRGEKKAGDGIPNILSPDDSFVLGIRQKAIKQVDLDKWLDMDPEEFCVDDKMLARFRFNEALIDLTKTPETIKKKIIDQYENKPVAKRSNLMNYMFKHKLKLLIESIQDF